MFASTNVFTASPEFGATPSVATVNAADPFTDRVDVACPVTVPAVADVKVTEHCPDAFVVHANGPEGDGFAPFAPDKLIVMLSPAAAVNDPAPVSFSSVAVNVCGCPIALVAFGAIEMRAFTQVLVAGPELAPTPSVLRVSDTPPTESVVWALTFVTPVTADVMVVVQLPEPPVVVHDVGGFGVPGPASMVNVISVPFGALTNPPPEPSFTFTCAVNVCVAPMRFVPFGVI